MRFLFELISIFDIFTPTIALGKEVKRFPKETAKYHHLFVKADSYPTALAVLQNMKIKPTEKMHDFLRREWHIGIEVPMSEMGRVNSALQRAGVKYRS